MRTNETLSTRAPSESVGLRWRCCGRYTQLMFSLATTAAPHATILGNHDAEAVMTREDIIQLDSKSHLSVTPPPDGAPGAPQAGNYWLNVRSETRNETALRLWMLDSMNRGCGGVPGWCG